MEIAYSLASEELHPTDMVHAARRAEELGFQNTVFVHQIGPDQEGFLRFFAEEVLPKV